jgi:hypothetical protein
MKVANEYLSTKEGLTAGEMEEKIESLVDILQKNGASVVTKEDVELLESAEQSKARARKTWDFKYTTDEKDARSHRRPEGGEIAGSFVGCGDQREPHQLGCAIRSMRFADSPHPT